jgi:hypothetical protein
MALGLETEFLGLFLDLIGQEIVSLVSELIRVYGA